MLLAVPNVAHAMRSSAPMLQAHATLTTASLRTAPIYMSESVAVPSLPFHVLAEGDAPALADAGVVTDTLLDLAVYSLLAGVVALTLYSIVVTLQASNEQYGGWTKKDDDEVMSGSLGQDKPVSRLQSGARYDPVTDTWTYPTPEEQANRAKVGRAPTASSTDSDAATNRYDRRMAKKRKQAQKKAKGGRQK